MMGFGAYGGNGGSSSLSSNLSASAQPFTVERPIAMLATTPLLDLNEASFNPPLNSSLQNWVNPCRPDCFSELDSMPSANSYRCPGPNPFNQPQTAPSLSLDPIGTASNDAFSYNPNPDCSKNDFVEAKPYYPSYVPPTVHFTTPHVATFNGSSPDQRLSSLESTTKWGGSWEGFPDWGHSKKVHAGGSFHSNEMNATSLSIYEDHMNLGAQASKVMKTFEETSPGTCMLSKEKHVESANMEKLDYVSVIGQTPLSTPNFVVPDLKTTLGKPVKPKKNLIPFSNPYGNFPRAHGTASTYSLSPGLVIQPPAIGSSSSAFSTVPSKNVNTVSDATDSDSTQNYPSTMKERCALVGHTGGLCFDPIQLSINLDGNRHPSAEISSGKNEELSGNIIPSKDTSDQLLCVRSGVDFSGVSSNGFNRTAVNNVGVGIQVENSPESSDCYNPAVDSPCWKGAPVPLYSPFGASEAVAMQLLKKPEACSGSNGQASKHIPVNSSSVLKLSYEKPGETLVSEENCCLQNGLLPSARIPSVSDMSFVNQPNDAWKVGSNHGRPSSNYRFEISEDTNHPRKEYLLFNKSTNEADLMPSWTMQQTPEEETSLCPSSADEILVKHVEPHGKDSAQMINVNALINTMHNLSELLLFHCSNVECELKKQDYEALKIVILNLDKCMSKNIGLELSADPNKGKSKGDPLKKAVDIQREPPQRHLEEIRNYTGEKDGESSGFLLVRGHAEMKLKDDKNQEMTQAIKKVLSENFHEKEETNPQTLLYKNLWLEAEAALCSVNYLARYNRMKMEMEQCKLDSAKVLSEDTADEEKVSKVSPDIKTDEKLTPASEGGPSTDVSVQDYPIISTSSNTNDIIRRFHILMNQLENVDSNDALDEVKISSPTVCSKVDKLDPEVNYSQISEVSTQEDIEASVMTRLHILKSRSNNSSPGDMERLPLPGGVDLGFGGQLEQWPIDNNGAEEMSDANMEPVLLHEAVNTATEFLLRLKHDSVSQSPGSNSLGNPVSAGLYDGSSSDWEHVLKEELSEQNS